jgi:hypothetical protein
LPDRQWRRGRAGTGVAVSGDQAVRHGEEEHGPVRDGCRVPGPAGDIWGLSAKRATVEAGPCFLLLESPYERNCGGGVDRAARIVLSSVITG